ncbi:MAG: SAM-dependent methyltransferase, partial [Clostridia bacterium]|nr:SAM-dependent methyltransferase [Clostridia bacterium]
ELGISDETGRIHDKKQAKFRQINRFLEHIKETIPFLPREGKLLIYDLCCGKSYLSFATYYYFTAVLHRETELYGMDLKADCMSFCRQLAQSLGFDGMRFETGDIRLLPRDRVPDLVLSLHACDIATDIVLQTAPQRGAKVLLSTPCCHHDLSRKIQSDGLRFVTEYPQLRGKLAEALTDGLRLARLRAYGYDTAAMELTDPDDTPKNTLLRAVKKDVSPQQLQDAREKYKNALRFVLGRDAEEYPFA